MAMTKAELLNVFRDAASAEFADYSPYESDYSYEFSERFERRMNRLVKSESRPAWRFVNTNPRRLIIIAIVIVMALFAVACAVPEIRESIAGFFVQMFTTHTEITSFDSKEQRKTIEDKYELSSIPDGFFEKSSVCSKSFLKTEYIDESLTTLTLQQIAGSNRKVLLDCEHGDYSKHIITGKEVFIDRKSVV